MRCFLWLLIAALLLPPAGALAAKDNRAQLEEISKRIENVQIDLAEKKQVEIQVSRDLALLKQTLQRIDGRISSLEEEIRQLVSQQRQQEQQVDESRRALRGIGQRIEKRLIALYKEGEVGPLRILFSADSPTELVQQYQYLTRVLQHDQQLLGEYRQAIEQQQLQLAELDKIKSQQQQLLDKQQQQRRDAEQGRKLQSRLLAKVGADKQRLGAELTELKEKAGRLQELMARLEKEQKAQRERELQKQKEQQQTREAKILLPAKPGAADFLAGKGKLGWPVNGEVLIGFGTQRDAQLGTIYESNGIEIAVPANQPVRAVANGRVVFADWFKGYGNLLIVGHEGGYHTLYAQTARLERKIGDTVAAGDVVAVSGLGGRDGIYFEIRQNGTPVDPLVWLQRR